MPPPMGQPITVVEKQSSNPGILRFETNRPLSGLSHERYAQAPDPLLDRPVDELARRLFAAGGVEHVHINGSVVTVTLGRGQTGAGLADIVRGLFLHYTETPLDETVDPPTDEGDRTPDMTADPGDTPAAQEAEEPAAADPPAPEAAAQPDASATEAGVAPPTTEPAAEIVADAPVVDEPEA
jgi:hypothetical protein